MTEEFSLPKLIQWLQPKVVVELGTGDGATANRIMTVLPSYGRLVCINWPNPPSGDNPQRYLAPWLNDTRLMLICGDTRDTEISERVPNNIDVLHIDSTHTYECASVEWELYRPKMRDGGTVVVDDLDHNDMNIFWGELPYEKTVVNNGRVGMFIFMEGK